MKRLLVAAFLMGLAAVASAQTDTPTPSNTPTSTPTATATPTPSNTPTASNTPTPTNTATATNTPTNTRTFTPAPLAPIISLVVPSGGTLSNELWLNPGEQATITIFTPSTVEGTGSVEISSDGGTTWKTLQTEAGVDIAIVAGKAVPLPPISSTRMRIKQGAAAASRVYVVAGTTR